MSKTITASVSLLPDEDIQKLKRLADTTTDPEKKILAESLVSVGSAIRSLFDFLDQISKSGPLKSG